jgi:hypothetical protein
MYFSHQIMSTTFPTSSKMIALMIAAVKVPVTFASALLLKVGPISLTGGGNYTNIDRQSRY